MTDGNVVPKKATVTDWLRWLTDGTSSLVLFALMAMTCVDVVGRYFFNSPLDGATELTQLMMGVIIFAVLPTVCFREEHISVDLMDIWFPERLINSRQLVISIITTVAMSAVAWRVWIVAERTTEYGDSTEFLGIAYAPIYYFVSVMCAFSAIAIACNIPRYIRGQGPLSPGRDPSPSDRDDDGPPESSIM